MPSEARTVSELAEQMRQLRNEIPTLAPDRRTFATSLCEQWEKRGSLSPKQIAWVPRLLGREDRPRIQADFSPVVTLMCRAAQHLKYPKIRLASRTGCAVLLQLATAGKYRGDVHVTDGGPYGNNTYFGRIAQDGGFEGRHGCPADVLELLTDLARDPATVAGRYGHMTGNCCFCGRELEDERSTSVGYGPICADHYALPWGAKGDA